MNPIPGADLYVNSKGHHDGPSGANKFCLARREGYEALDLEVSKQMARAMGLSLIIETRRKNAVDGLNGWFYIKGYGLTRQQVQTVLMQRLNESGEKPGYFRKLAHVV